MSGNHKVSALNQAIRRGYKVSFWDTGGRVNISVSKNGEEVALYIDDAIANKSIVGTAFSKFADDVVFQKNWAEGV